MFLVGGGSEVLCADLMLVAILVKYEFARNFERVVMCQSCDAGLESQNGDGQGRQT